MRLIVLLAALCSGLLAEDWPRFRGADGSASSDAAKVPLTWDSETNIAWKCPLPGAGSSSPVVYRDRLYVTAYTGYGVDPDNPGRREDLKLHVICVDRTSGDLRWDQSFAASPNEQEATRRVIDHGYATGTAACDETGVYAYFGVSGLVAFNHDGKQRWRAITGTKTAGFGSAASPILHGEHVIVNSSIEAGNVQAFDRETGKLAWQIDDVDKSWTTPLVASSPKGEPELILSSRFHVRGFDPADGRQLWTCEGVQDYVVPCVVAHEGIAYVLGGRKNQSLAIRLGGRGDVTGTHLLWSTNVGANVTSPVCHDGYLHWASDRGIVCCLNATTGDVVYRERLPTRSRVYASTLRVGDRLYHTMRDAGVLVTRATPKFEQLALNVIDNDDSKWNASPAAVDHQLFFRTNRFVYCISESK